MLQLRMDIHLDPLAIDTMVNSPYGEVGRWLARKGAEMRTGAEGMVGVRTGRLRASISVSQERVVLGQQLVVGADAVRPGTDKSYAYDHHEGTRPHIIAPRPGGELVFVSRGRRIGSRVVKHPGTRANKFLSSQLVLLKSP